MRNAVNLMLDDINDLREDLKVWVVNKEIPLEERWDVFIKSKLGSTDNYILRLDSLPKEAVSYEGIISAERYQTVDMEEAMERIEDVFSSIGTEWEIEEAKELDIPVIKEEILEKFIWSFIYDW